MSKRNGRAGWTGQLTDPRDELLDPRDYALPGNRGSVWVETGLAQTFKGN